MTIVEICVHMDCQGCERKIRKALQRVEGVREVEIDLKRQKVTVTGWVDQNKALKAVRKTGRKAVLWPYGYSNGNGNTYTSQQYPNGNGNTYTSQQYPNGNGNTYTSQQYPNQQYHPALAQNGTSYSDANYSSSTPSYNYSSHGYGAGYDNSRVNENYRHGAGYDNSRVHENYGHSAGYDNSRVHENYGHGAGYDNSRVHENYGHGAGYDNSRVHENYGHGAGYDNSRVYGNYGYDYQPQPAPQMYPARVGKKTEDVFSDENTSACSIM